MDCLRRRDRNERQWHLATLWSVLADRPARRKLSDSVKAMPTRSWRRTESLYEGHDDETRLLLIGAALNSESEQDGKIVILSSGEREAMVAAWLQLHPHEAEWLAEHDITPLAARQHHAKWLEGRRAWLKTAHRIGINPKGETDVRRDSGTKGRRSRRDR